VEFVWGEELNREEDEDGEKDEDDEDDEVEQSESHNFNQEETPFSEIAAEASSEMRTMGK